MTMGARPHDDAIDAEGAIPRLVPPRVEPAPHPLRFPLNLVRTLTDNVALVPRQAYEDDVVIAPGPPRMAFVTGPEAVEPLLMSRDGRFPKGKLQNAVLGPMMGEAMIASEGEKWRRQRQAAAPLFRHEELLRYVPVMARAAGDTIAGWRAAAGSGPASRAIDRDMMRAAFAVISATMLARGADNVLAAIEQGHGDYFGRVNWWVLYCMLGLPHALPRPGGTAMRAHERRTRAAVRELVLQRLADNEPADDLLARLVRVRDPETDTQMPIEQVVENILAFLIAGFDTTALSLTWALYLLARSPAWAERIAAEVESVAGESPIEARHLPSLIVTEQVLKETMRLYPTAPIIVRDVREDVTLAGTRIPAGTIAIVPIYAIHRHRRFWRDPDAFDPGRFAPDAAGAPGRYNYLPFGAGPRICIGAAFTMIETKVLLANFVRAARFEVEPGYEPRPTGQMFLTTGGRMPMRVHLRAR
ncbi:MAG: cytochrome P450 [Rhizobiales bacterium]|nr:cytochrome P450 [Hyphomicrobiales bacterium]